MKQGEKSFCLEKVIIHSGLQAEANTILIEGIISCDPCF